MNEALNEAVIYLLRKTSLTLKEIGGLTPNQFAQILKEIQYQEAVETYERQYEVASILSAIYTTIPQKHPKRYKPSDFLKTEPPQRIGTKKVKGIKNSLKDKGIEFPKEK